MGRREIAAGLLFTLFGSGCAALIGVTAVSAQSPYSPLLQYGGAFCIAVSMVGLLGLAATARRGDRAAVQGAPALKSAKALVRSSWRPNMNLWDLAVYVGSASHWSKGVAAVSPTKSAHVDQIADEIAEKFFSGQVTAWGRAGPRTREFQIASAAWENATIHLGTNSAFLPKPPLNVYVLRVARGEVEIAWPRR